MVENGQFSAKNAKNVAKFHFSSIIYSTTESRLWLVRQKGKWQIWKTGFLVGGLSLTSDFIFAELKNGEKKL